MKRILVLVAVVVGALAYAGVAQAATATLSGTAVVEGDHVKMVSDFSDDPANTANNFGAVSFTDTGVTTFNSITTLSAEFNVTEDACLGGSPRFTIDFAATTNNVHIYLGTHNPATGQFDCAPNTWISSGNLIGVVEPRYDLTQFGGPFYGTYAQAQALVGGLTVDQIIFAVDGGWAFTATDKEQTVLLRTATVNTSVFTWPVVEPPTMLNPAQACRALRAQVGETNFVNTWGTNTNKRNAFGKCVSHMAKLQNQATAAAQTACQNTTGEAHKLCVATKAKARFNAKRAALTAAVNTCAAAKNANLSAFLATWGKGNQKNVKAAFAACVRSKD
jgi:hypothetical protein